MTSKKSGSNAPPDSLTDSPWYWVYLFCTAGLIALILAGSKFGFRQSQIERSGQGRQRAIQNIAGREPTTAMSDVENTHIRLQPLYYVLAALLLVAWANLIRRRIVGRNKARRTPSPLQPLSTPIDTNLMNR